MIPMPQAKRTETVSCKAEDLYNVIVDYEQYPDFVDGVSDIEVLECDESGARVQYSLNLIKKFKYILKLTHDRPQKVSWELESGDLFKRNNGSWTLNSIDDGNTEVTYEIDVDFKGFAPKMVINKLVENNLPAMMNSYFERVK